MEISFKDAFQIIELILDARDAPDIAYKALNFIYKEYDRLQFATQNSPREETQTSI